MEPILLPIGNHAKLIYIHADRFKSEMLSVSFSMPLKQETAQQNAVLMALLRRATARYPTFASLNRHLDDMYSTAVSSFHRRTGDMQTMGFAADFLGARYVGGGLGLLPSVVTLLGELFYAPLLDERGVLPAENVNKETKNLRDAIRAAIHNPRGYATSHCRKLLCAGEPYALSLIGTEEEIDTLTPEGLTARYHAFLGELVPVFCYVGATPAAAVTELLEKAFAPSAAAVAAPHIALVHGGSGLAVGEEEKPLLQGKLSLGFRTDVGLDHPLAPAMLYLNEIFGGSPASKLFMEVREKKSLCYHCSSSLDLHKGILFAGSGMKVENRAVTEEAMLQQLEEIKRGNITEAELQAARKSIDYSYRQSFDHPDVLARFYTGRVLVGNSETIEGWRTRLSTVSKEEIVEAAAHVAHRATFFLKGTRDEGEDEEEEG